MALIGEVHRRGHIEASSMPKLYARYCCVPQRTDAAGHSTHALLC